jgi:hypothetical protein
MPVHNGIDTLERAIDSVRGQSFTGWELLAIDDSSDDGSYEQLIGWGTRDGRIRVLRNEQNLGPSATRNAGLEAATGDMVAYLDCDDEFYAKHFEHIQHFATKGDVLVFAYDYIEDFASGQSNKGTWNPALLRRMLFAMNCSTPLGVAHRRELYQRTRGFDENLWCLEDWELWKRLARTGAEFLYLPLRSGLYHIRPGSRSRAPRLTTRQTAFFAATRQAGGCLYGSAAPMPARDNKRVLFASPSCLLDGSPAAQSALDMLEFLSANEFTCQAFCSGHLGLGKERSVEDVLGEQVARFESKRCSLGPFTGRLVYAIPRRVPLTLVNNEGWGTGAERSQSTAAFLSFYEKALDAFLPDVLVTCGEDGVTDAIISLAKRRDIAVVFAVWSLGFRDPRLFRNVDYCFTHTEFARTHYWRKIGLHCQTLPYMFDFDQAAASERRAEVVTILAPDPTDGLPASHEIAKGLQHSRQDIPVAVRKAGITIRPPDAFPDGSLEGKSGECARPLSGGKAHLDTRIVVVPSLGFGTLDGWVAEAMLNGIPVVVSNRGPLPEVVGKAGIVLGMPEDFGQKSNRAPGAEVFSHWLEAIARLWDDPGLYAAKASEVINHSRRWHPSRTSSVCVEFFRNLCPQPGPPLIPKWLAGSEAAVGQSVARA